MARLAGVVVPGLPHHVTPRGNRREPVLRSRRVIRPAPKRGRVRPQLAGLAQFPRPLLPRPRQHLLWWPRGVRATGITAYLKNGGTLEKAAAMANHASTRTTQRYDRRHDEMSLDEIERVVI
jgi:hypothetical protein